MKHGCREEKEEEVRYSTRKQTIKERKKGASLMGIEREMKIEIL